MVSCDVNLYYFILNAFLVLSHKSPDYGVVSIEFLKIPVHGLWGALEAFVERSKKFHRDVLPAKGRYHQSDDAAKLSKMGGT